MGTAIVTGGAVRLGRAMALHLAEKGFNIALHYHSSSDKALEIIDEINASGVICKGYRCDLSDTDEASRLIEMALKDFDDISLLINSAAIFQKATIEETTKETLEGTIRINLIAPFILMRDYKVRIGSGQIINILDQRIARHLPSFAAYSVSKVALAHLTELAAVEFGDKVRVNGIAPGLILPPHGRDEDYLERQAESIPLKRPGSIDAVLKGLDYLLDNSFVHGEILFIDGGESKGG